MGKPISLFSGYSQIENRTTNYCLLILKLLYEENPRFLADVFGVLFGEDLAEHVGVKFRQQERKGLSVPDGLIIQKPISIFLETKTFDWFYDAQLESHLASLDQASSGLKVLIALGNFEQGDGSRFDHLRTLCKNEYRGEILFNALTFEDFIASLNLPHLPKNLADSVAELRAFFDEQDLLPSWGNWLDVINCALFPEDILEANVYMCPATGGAYSHERSAFFGMYRNKRVDKIADIAAVVDVQSKSSAAIKWKNRSADDSILKRKAIEVVLKRRPDEIPTRVFLLGEIFETDFIKDSPGGMMGSKQYFNISQFKARSAEELAKALRGKTWSDLR